MNKQFKELAEQAEDDVVADHRGDEFHKAYTQRFAELMIVEFTEAVKQTATRIAQTGFNDGLSAEEVNKRVNGALFVLDVMRERFGVEDAPVNDVDRILRTVRTRG